MKKHKIVILIALGAFILTSTSFSDDVATPDEKPQTGLAGDNLLQANLDYLVKANEIPAIATIVVKDGALVEKGCSGIRSLDGAQSVTLEDKWHLGSITKSTTSSLVAILVQEGVINWDLKIGDLVNEGIHPGYTDVTIKELLSHTSGVISADVPVDPFDNRTLPEIREEWVFIALNQEPDPSKSFAYSNNNYVIVGAMLEAILEDSWENIISNYLFKPLGMNDTGFGVPGSGSAFDQPWGHTGTSPSWDPRDPDNISSENPLAIGPAGTVHSTLEDIVKYMGFHQGKSALISENNLEILHEEVKEASYALGWNVVPSGTLFHSGSNGRWFAQLVLAPDGVGLLAVTNSFEGSDGGKSVKAVQDALALLGQRYENSK